MITIKNTKKNYPEYLMQDVRQSLGLAENDKSKDKEINNMPPEEFFKYVCTWNGILGYSNQILSWLKDIYNA